MQTLAYNAEKTIHRCVNSILSQTYRGEIEWHILDNGSIDNTLHILMEYAQDYPFIHVSHIDKNQAPQNAEEKMLWEQVTLRANIDLSDDDFYCMLDSDDEYKVDFFEKMMLFIHEYCLDIALAGNDFIDEKTGSLTGVRKLKQSLLLSNADAFTKYFPVYHAHMRPVWGKLFRGATIRNYIRNENLTYGNDTCFVFHALRQASRVGIFNESLYKYYINPKSTSYSYTSNRIFSDVYLYNDAIDFLSAFGPVSPQNRTFLQAVYSNAVSDTVGVIRASGLSPMEKLREYRKIAEYPITRAAYRECTDECAWKSKTLLLQMALEAGVSLGKQDDSDLRVLAQLLLPHCGQAITAGNIGVFFESPELLRALLRDDADALLNILLERLRNNQGTKKYSLPKTVQALAADNPLLCRIDDAVFLRKYGEFYEKVWKGEHLDALDGMAGLLMDGKVSGGRETFLELFISLAAAENQIPAFIVGKMQLADLYFRQNRREECQSIVLDLTEMGVESDELSALRQELTNR